MKQILSFALAATLLGCSAGKEFQMDIADVQLIKIDTVQRYPNAREKVLTWQDDNHISYVTFAPVEDYYVVGSRMRVMVRK